MDNLQNHILKCHDIEVIAFLLNDINTLAFIQDLLSKSQYKNVILVTEDDAMYQNTVQSCKPVSIQTEIIRVTELDDVCMDALVFDTEVKLQSLLYTGIKTRYLFGHIEHDSLPYFTIWEHYRSRANKIIIDRTNANGRRECLIWEGTAEDIELSVIFPVYKVRDYLEQCIESVIAWQAPYIEFLFVNDGSPDDSADIIAAYQKKDARIKLLHKENGGCASARQYGLDRAQGRYVGFVDPDDFIDPNMFQKLLSRALMGNYQIAYSGYNEYYESTNQVMQVDDVIGSPYSEGTTEINDILDLIIYRRIAIWRAVYRRDYLEVNHIGFNSSFKRFDDLPFKVETLLYAKSVVSIPEYLYYYRLNRPGQDVSCDDQRLYVHFDIFEYLDDIVNKLQNQKLLDYLQIVKLHTHTWALELVRDEFALEYVQKAKKDLLKNMTVKRSMVLAKRYTGKKHLLSYMAIMLEKPDLYRKILLCKKIRK